MRHWAGGFLVILLLAAPLPASALGLEAAIGGWYQMPGGDVAYKPLSSSDTLDLEDDLGLDDEFRPFGRIRADLPLFFPNIYVMFTPMEFKGSGFKEVDFRFGDRTFTADTAVDATVTLDHWDVALFYGIPMVKTATLDKLGLDVGLNVRIFDAKATLNQPTTGNAESESYTLPVPMLFAAARFQPVKRLGLEAELRGMAYGDVSVFSVIGRVKVKIFGPAWAAGGYRLESVDVESDDLTVDTVVSGPFLEMGFSF